MKDQTWDVVYHSDKVSLEPHFCREWGCYGTNPDHGLTLEEAVDEIAEYYEREAKAWRDGTHETLVYYREQEEFDQEN